MGSESFSLLSVCTMSVCTTLLAYGLAILPADATSFAASDAVSVHLLSGEAGMLEESALQTNAPVDLKETGRWLQAPWIR